MANIKGYDVAEKFMNDEFEQHVPGSGKCETLYGEIIRATMRLMYRNWNDGDHLGVGYGRETCNPAGRFLLNKINDSKVTQKITDAWGVESDGLYDCALEMMVIAIVEYLKANAEELKAQKTEDMFDYRDSQEDVDYPDEDEYEDDYEDDYYDENEDYEE